MTQTASERRAPLINVPEAVGVFDDAATLQAAIYDLMMAGFSRYDISLLGDAETLEKTLGKSYWKSAELEDDPNAPRAAFVSEESIGELEGVVAGGFFFLGSYIALAAMMTPVATLAASIAAIAIGGAPAGALGALLARRIGKHHENQYAEQIRHGGILLWVRTMDADKEALAVKILKGHSGKDVHVHPWSEA